MPENSPFLLSTFHIAGIGLSIASDLFISGSGRDAFVSAQVWTGYAWPLQCETGQSAYASPFDCHIGPQGAPRVEQIW